MFLLIKVKCKLHKMHMNMLKKINQEALRVLLDYQNFYKYGGEIIIGQCDQCYWDLLCLDLDCNSHWPMTNLFQAMVKLLNSKYKLPARTFSFSEKECNFSIIFQCYIPRLLQKLLLRRALSKQFSPKQTTLTCRRLSIKTELGACKETSSGPEKKYIYIIDSLCR